MSRKFVSSLAPSFGMTKRPEPNRHVMLNLGLMKIRLVSASGLLFSASKNCGCIFISYRLDSVNPVRNPSRCDPQALDGRGIIPNGAFSFCPTQRGIVLEKEDSGRARLHFQTKINSRDRGIGYLQEVGIPDG